MKPVIMMVWLGCFADMDSTLGYFATLACALHGLVVIHHAQKCHASKIKTNKQKNTVM